MMNWRSKRKPRKDLLPGSLKLFSQKQETPSRHHLHLHRQEERGKGQQEAKVRVRQQISKDDRLDGGKAPPEVFGIAEATAHQQ